MTLSRTQAINNYTIDFVTFIRKVEDHSSAIYYDTAAPANQATVGDGINIDVSTYLRLVLNQTGILNAADEQERERREDLMMVAETPAQRVSRINNLVRAFQGEIATNRSAQTSTIEERAAAGSALNDRFTALAHQYGMAATYEFGLDETNSQSVVRQILQGANILGVVSYTGKESALDTVLGQTPANQNILPHNSKEYVAVMSIFYNGERVVNSSSQKLVNALKEDRRADAWFEIRYNSNGGQNRNGTAKRRYYEAQVFGLYGSETDVSLQAAEDIYQMFSKNLDAILLYERTFGTDANSADHDVASNRIALANSDYDLDGQGEYAQPVQTLTQALNDAKQAVLEDLQGKYAALAGLDVDTIRSSDVRLAWGATGSILSGADGDSRNARNVLIGGVGTDLLRGGAGNDVLVGGDGFDFLVGGTGDDILIGGEGNDIYIYRTGDGNDQIIDPDGGTINIDGEMSSLSAAGAFIQTPGQNLWTRQEGEHTITLSHNSPWRLTLEDGSTIELGENFNPAAFKMRLVDDQQAQFSADRTILGDLSPVDFDTSSEGVQIKRDDLENVIVDPTKPSLNHDDQLFDSSGNDLILAGGGDDNIDASRGGNDRLDGGSGNDIIVGRAGNDIVIGGQGGDLLRGDEGRDTLYADDELKVADALLQQDAAPSGLRGDFIDAGNDDDTIIGGVGNDALNGGQGADLILGGAGNDDIDGDLETDLVTRDWSVTRSITQSGAVYQSTYNDVVFSLPTAGGDDVIYGGAGNDWIRGRQGNDFIDGGSDDDVLFGEAGNDNLIGGSGNDVLGGDTTSLGVAQPGDDYLDGGEGNDKLHGNGGNDVLLGGAGDDTLSGGAGADQLSGGLGNDQIAGDEGGEDSSGSADEIDGGDGDDLIDAQGGDDVVFGGNGNDLIAGRLGNDMLSGGAGNDLLQGDEGDDVLDGGEGVDKLFGRVGADTLLGGAGNDQLAGEGGDDNLDGGADNDSLWGQDGNDILSGGDGSDNLLGGAGDDILEGGSGNDFYRYGLGDGRDRIVDTGGTDWLVFTGGILFNDVRLDIGSLKLVLPDGGEVHLDDFDPSNPLAGAIEYFQFSDNTVLTRQQLIQTLGFQIEGTPTDDTLVGTNLGESIQAFDGNDVVAALGGNDTLSLGSGDDWANAGEGDDQILAGDGQDNLSGGDGADRLDGGSGNDQLFGDAGSDLLDGGVGDDTLSGGGGNDGLNGGDGNDTYLFGLGAGQDVATDNNGANTVQLIGGLTETQVSFSRVAADLILAVNGTTDRLTVKDYFTPANNTWAVVLGDGVVLDRAAVEERLGRNGVPLASEDQLSLSEDAVIQATGNALSNDRDPEGRTLRVTNPGTYVGSFGNLSLGSNGSYTYTLNNASSSVQALTAGQVVTERFAYTVTDDEPAGAATASSEIVVSITGRNDSPVLSNDTVQLTEDSAVSASGNLLANDKDIDAGTTLSVTAPGSFVGAYGSLTLAADGAYGYALNNQSVAVQTLGRNQQVVDQFSYTATDGIAATSASLTVTIAGSNDAPQVAIPLSDLTAVSNSAFSWTLPAGTFSDVDRGDVLSYQAGLADGSPLPSWLVFDAATQTLSGRAPRDASGFIEVRLSATDSAAGASQSSNLSVSDIFRISFESTNGGGGNGGGGNGSGGHGGGSQGNAGVGNGADAPPPGHDSDFNDGPGTAPGSPGAQGGNGLAQMPSLPVMAAIVVATPDGSIDSVRATGTLSQDSHGQSRKQDATQHTVSDDKQKGSIGRLAQINDTGAELQGETDAQAQIGPSSSSIKDWWQGKNHPLSGYTPNLSQPETEDGAPSAPADVDQLAATFARWVAVDEELEAAKAKANGAVHAGGDHAAGALVNPGQFLGAGNGLGHGGLATAGAGADMKPLQGLSEGMHRIA